MKDNICLQLCESVVWRVVSFPISHKVFKKLADLKQ